MADYSAEGSIGARIAAARRARGYRTTKELASAMSDSGITAAILENIESGRKASLDVSQVLNISKALRVPVSSLLAPMARPADLLDLPNLGTELSTMTAAEFDAWLSTVQGADYTATSADERNDRAQLLALRELQTMRRELSRLQIVADLEASVGVGEERLDTLSRVDWTKSRIHELRTYLTSVGWEV
jgi:transcriptional regulator with XRE-family HTH domain